MHRPPIKYLVIFYLIYSQTFLVWAQTMPTADAAQPIMSPETDTLPPSFISVASMSGEEGQAIIMWTTDGPAYGYVEYGPSTSYG